MERAPSSELTTSFAEVIGSLAGAQSVSINGSYRPGRPRELPDTNPPNAAIRR